MNKQESLDFLKQCVEDIKHMTPEQIKKAQEHYDAMPPAEYYRPPEGLEILLPTGDVDENGNTIYRTETYEGE